MERARPGVVSIRIEPVLNKHDLAKAPKGSIIGSDEIRTNRVARKAIGKLERYVCEKHDSNT